MQKYYFQIAPADYKKRLDTYLQEQFPTLSKIYLRGIVRDEKCEVNGEWKSRGYLVKPNDFVEVELEQRDNNLIEPEEIRLEIIHEESDFLIVNKAAGMLIHPTVKVRRGTLLNALAFHLNNGRDYESQMFIRAGLVHRLDKQTSGLVVIAKNQRSLRFLCSHFQRRLVEKKYFALVEGIIKEDSGTIDANIGRYEETRFWNIKEDGKRAVTNFWVRRRFEDSTLVELEPVTGRTNQLRIHLAHINHPIFGDIKYGGREFSRLCLHAYKLNFHHPNGGKRMEFETANPFIISEVEE